jgi:prephenate dehydratase
MTPPPATTASAPNAAAGPTHPAAQPGFAFAFQGERGAFSQDAGYRFFGPGTASRPCRDFDELFAAVVQGTADAAVVPIENTLAGPIIKNYDLLLEHDVVIAGEVVLRVVHNVIGLPGVDLAEIRRVYSHPVALAQCERFLRDHPGIEAIAAYDTAGSVKQVMEAGRRDEAAIAGDSAALAYAAQILVAGVQSNPQNFTRFFVVTRVDRAAGFAQTFARSEAAAGEPKASLVFRTSHRPGGLHAALGAFAEAAINLTKIESRPIPGRPFEYSFYLDFLGDPADPQVARALAQLQSSAESVRLLGTYPRGEQPT